MRDGKIVDIVRIAAAELLKQRESVIQEKFDFRYHDVKLLMKNYRHVENALRSNIAGGTGG